MAQKMDRGSDACKAHLGGTTSMEIRQTRKGWFQELLGCEARTEFKYFIGTGDNQTQVAHSLEEASCMCRWCCQPCHPFVMEVKEVNTESELLTVERPYRCPAGGCKCCCCWQEAFIKSGGTHLGAIKEDCYICVPSFTLRDHTDTPQFIVHPPTCLGGCCFNPCTEGNPCFGRGCCKFPFRIYPYAQKGSTNGDAPFLGKILKKPKSAFVEIFTDANAFDVTFPVGASVDEKAMLVGSTLLINAVFFETDNQN